MAENMFTGAELLRRIKRNGDGSELPGGEPLMKAAQHGRLAIDAVKDRTMTNGRQEAIERLNNRITTLLVDMRNIYREAKRLHDSVDGNQKGDQEQTEDHVPGHLQDVVVELAQARESLQGAAASVKLAVTGKPYPDEDVVIRRA